ncbi:Phage integrase family protein [Pseudooceanicola nitratireducens]|uniref:Phage integrase family protein n=2 Tax=Pseudooceanicola nitratireducens TaxID=517719 RepID=A0A1I1J9Z3_9RHOB|nr:Phage integrase family protein [Pseudooceanicola nitratireducens]SFC44951.1 Phage integrase family protein [Pseudooceanicola nitratireducens]
MPKHSLTLPRSSWPEDLRTRFERRQLSESQRKRLGSALGRWLKIADDLGVDARAVSRQTWLERTQHMTRALRNEVRQALAIAFPDAAASLYADDYHGTLRQDPRVQLRAMIARNLARFPDDWRDAAMPLLHVDEAGLGDGILVQAWAPSTIKRRLEGAALHFDYCRTRQLAVDITPKSLRAKLREDQARVESGERRLGGVAIDVAGLAGFAAAVRPERSWAWLMTARNRLKKLANYHGSRNASRAIDAAELRAAGQQLLDKADALHAAARNRRALVAAHTKARTALMMILLAEAPIRITSCAEVELRSGLLDDLTGLFLDGSSTKEGDIDRRAFSATLTDAIGRYVGLHRAVVAAREETRLLVGERGGPIKAAQLSKNLGDFTEPLFGVRVTPHAIRHSVGNFIVATAPDEAALATIILNHRSDAVTPAYHQRADQIVASRKLREAAESSAAALSVDTSPTRRNAGRMKLGNLRRRAITSRAQTRFHRKSIK